MRSRIMSLLAPPGVVTVAVVAAAAAKALAERLGENDLWWHLRAGEIVVAERGLPADPFSYTAAGEPWVIQHWLAEVILFGIESAAGLRGIIVWRALMLVVIYALVAGLFRREAGPTFTTAAVFAGAAMAGSRGWVERPSLFSLLMFVLVLRAVRGTRPWLTVPLVLVWANLHGMVVMGLGLLVLVATAETAKVLFSWAGADRARARTTALVAAAGIAASLVNPYGPRLLGYSFDLIEAVQSTAAEWASPDFHETIPLLFLILSMGCVASLGLARARPDATDVALATAFIALGVYSERNLALSAVVVGLVTARALRSAFADDARVQRTPPERASPVIGGAAVIAVVVVLAFVVVPRFPRSGALSAVADERYPVETIEALPGSDVRLFADDRWAGLALFARWPGLCVAFDGRGDFYGPAGIQRYRDTIGGGDAAVAYLDAHGTTHVLVEASSGLAATLRDDVDWDQVRTDQIEGGTAVLFARDAPSGLPACAAAPGQGSTL